MYRFHRTGFVFCLILFSVSTAAAQLSGSRGGVRPGGDSLGAGREIPELSPKVAQRYITIEGQAELRVTPTEIRVVLAVTAEADTPAECERMVGGKIKTLTAAWREMGIAQDDIVEDFIAVLPRYEYEIERTGDREIAVEKRAGYLMQSNLHLAVSNDTEAMAAIHQAFDNDVADIIAFDYWSKDLDQTKLKARALALRAAREKSDVLLGAVLDVQPPVINLQESTRVYYPESLYESFSNSGDAEYQTTYSRRDIPQIRTFRPKNTYYRGFYLDGDVQSAELPMRPEISVVSTVRLYFESPAAKRVRSAGKDAD